MTVNRALPTAVAEGTSGTTPSRTGIYNEAYVNPLTGKELFSADEGSYFMALTPTPGTGIIGTVSIAAITDVSPTAVFYNGHATKRIYPQFLNLHETVVSTSGARVQFTFYLDNINRWTSGGTALTNGCTLSGASDTSGLAAHVGAVVSPAQNAKVLVDHVVFRGTIDVVEDQYEFVFGSQGGGMVTGPQATTVQHFSATLPPICILPGHSLVMHQWAASQANAPTYEYRFGYIAR
jgi:hypothetical protein